MGKQGPRKNQRRDEGPGLSRDEWGRVHPEFVGLAEEADNIPFPRWG